MQFVYALMWQDFGELAIYAKASVFPGRAVHSGAQPHPQENRSSIVELVNDILFDIPALICLSSSNGKYS
jgi:hypothetical protein